MEKERLTYIDELKGFAILMVVLGHVLSFTFGAFDTDYQSPFSTFIYGFHMPLFAFLSGLVIKRINTFSILAKRAARLLIPLATIGSLYSLWRGFSLSEYAMNDAKYGYWYLFFLFISYLVVTIYEWMLKGLIRHKSIWIDIVLAVAICVIISFAGNRIPNNSIFCYQISSHLYPYIFAGYIIAKHNLIDKLFSSSTLYEFAFVIMVFSFIVMRYLHHGSFLYLFRPVAVAFFVCLFYKQKNSKKLITAILRKMGGVSLSIYLFHYFFIHSSYLHCLSQYANSTGGVFIEVLLALILSVVICFCCVFIDYLVKSSHIMKFVCLGEYKFKKKV